MVGSNFTKYKECPKCNHENLSYASHCEECNTKLENIASQEKGGYEPPTTNSSQTNSGFCSFLNDLSWVYLVGGLTSCLFVLAKYTWIEDVSLYRWTNTRVFVPASFGAAMALLFSGLAMYAILNGIKRILEK